MNDSMIAFFTNTSKINQAHCRKAVKDLYKACGKSISGSAIYFTSGPREFANSVYEDKEANLWFDARKYNDIAHFGGGRSVTKSHRMKVAITSLYSESLKDVERKWSSPILFPDQSLFYDDLSDNWEKAARAVMDECYGIYTCEDECFVFERPVEVHHNERGLHCIDGPAIKFNDLYKKDIYYYEGMKVTKEQLMHPEKITLSEICKEKYNKHIMIDLAGIDRYIDLVSKFTPDVKGKFQNFFSFAKFAKMPEYTSRTEYKIEITTRFINGEHCLTLNDDYHYFSFPLREDALKYPYISYILNKEDYELWNILNIREAMDRGPTKLILSYDHGKYSLKSQGAYSPNHPACDHDIAPAWFKTKILRGQDAVYENDHIHVEYNAAEKKIKTESNFDVKNSLFGGNQQIPSYGFDLEVVGDSWEEFLENWAYTAFDWLGLHSDSTKCA